MKSGRTIFWVVIAIFGFLSVIFFVFFLNKNRSKNNISSSKLKEAKKEVNLTVLRYEKDLFSLDVNNLTKEVERLSSIYPPLLIEQGIWNDMSKMEGLKAYLQDTVILALYDIAEKTIKTDQILKELENAFGYYKVFYPNATIPKVITLIPGLDLSMPSVYIYDNILYVYIDMYLGANLPYYEAVGLPQYIMERCEPAFLSIDVFKKAIVYRHFQETRSTLLEAMISEGKRLYFTEMMFPDVHERFIIGYSEEKYNWANKFAGNTWSYLIEKNELFEKGGQLMRIYIEEAPFTKPFGNDSPGRMGTFLGWKLVQSYMKNNPKVTLPELMQDSDYQKILNMAKFKPQPK